MPRVIPESPARVSGLPSPRLHPSLDVARTFSSRLSSSLTIVVASLTVPGWLVHLLFRQARTPHGASHA